MPQSTSTIYRRICPVLWRSLAGCSKDEFILAPYILSGDQTNRIGLFSFSRALALETIPLAAEEFDLAFPRVIGMFGWQFDSRFRVLYIPTWFLYNPIQNPNVLTSMLRELSQLPKTRLLSDFAANTQYIPKHFRTLFRDTVSQLFPNGFRNGSDNDLGNDCPNAFGNDLTNDSGNESAIHNITIHNNTKHIFPPLPPPLLAAGEGEKQEEKDGQLELPIKTETRANASTLQTTNTTPAKSQPQKPHDPIPQIAAHIVEAYRARVRLGGSNPNRKMAEKHVATLIRTGKATEKLLYNVIDNAKLYYDSRGTLVEFRKEASNFFSPHQAYWESFKSRPDPEPYVRPVNATELAVQRENALIKPNPTAPDDESECPEMTEEEFAAAAERRRQEIINGNGHATTTVAGRAGETANVER